MAVDPRMYQNVAASIGSSPYNINVDTTYSGPSSKLFSSNSGVMNNPYHTDEVTDDFLRKLQIYTDAMLIGDIKTMSSEYLWAVQAAVAVLRHAKHPMSSERIERYWNEATEMKGSLPEDFARLIQTQLTR
jgi:hypothetical protein